MTAVGSAPRGRLRSSRPIAMGLALLLGGAVAAPAQQRPPDDQGRTGDRARLEQRIRARMGDIIRERLALDPQREEALSALVREYEERRRELNEEERRARSRLEELIDSGAPVPDEEAETLLRQVADVRMREAALFKEEQEQLLGILSASQVLELYELRRRIGQRIRAIREGRHGDGHDRGGPPGEDGGQGSEPGACLER